MSRVEQHKKILEEMNELYARKNADYGNSVGETYQKYGAVSYLVRIEDKLNRARTLLMGNNQLVNDEKVIDTLTDMANYCILLRMELENDINK